MAGKKGSTKRNKGEVSKNCQEALEIKKSEAMTATSDNGKMAGALDVVRRIVDAEPGTTSKGLFPELWTATGEALNQELQNQRVISGDIVRIAQKTTRLFQASRDNAVENLLNLIDELEARGDIDIPEA